MYRRTTYMCLQFRWSTFPFYGSSLNCVTQFAFKKKTKKNCSRNIFFTYIYHLYIYKKRKQIAHCDKTNTSLPVHLADNLSTYIVPTKPYNHTMMLYDSHMSRTHTMCTLRCQTSFS